MLSPRYSTVPPLLHKETSNTPKLVQYIRNHSLERKLLFDTSNHNRTQSPLADNLHTFLHVSPSLIYFALFQGRTHVNVNRIYRRFLLLPILSRQGHGFLRHIRR